MRKLKDDKKIRWKESYTEKTLYLKDQYEYAVGPHSYYRFEGKEISGPGEWYVVISPADTHEFEQKWFAGVRKLPAAWPAGGKKFDSLVDAFVYANDTWGVPKPKYLPHYTGRDLKGIEPRINEWKKEREESGSTERAVEKDSMVIRVNVIKKESMSSGVQVKGGLTWHHSDFDDLFNGMDRGGYNTDRVYRRLLASARDAFARIGFISDVADDEQFIAQAIESIESGSDGRGVAPIQETVPATPHVKDIGGFLSAKKRTGTWNWDDRNLFIKGIVERFAGEGSASDYYATESNMFFDDADLRRVIAACTAYKGRQERQSIVNGLLRSGMVIDEDTRTVVDRSNFEEALESMYVELRTRSQEYRSKYNVEDDEEDIPVNIFLEYSKVDSGSRIIYASPYTSRRNFNDEYCVSDDVFSSPEFNEHVAILFYGRIGDVQNYLSSRRDFEKNISRGAAVKVVDGLIDHMTASGAVNEDTIARGRQTFVNLFKGSRIPVAQDMDGQVVSVRARSGAHKSRIYEGLGAWYGGTYKVSDGLSSNFFPASFISGFSKSDKIMLAASPRVAAIEQVRDALDSVSISSPQMNILMQALMSLGPDESITPLRFKEICDRYGVPMNSVDILSIFTEEGTVGHEISKRSLHNLPSGMIGRQDLRQIDALDSDMINTVDLSMFLASQMDGDGNPAYSGDDINNIVDKGLSLQREGLSSVFSGIGIGADLRLRNNSNGTRTFTLDFQNSTYWKLFRALFGDVWGLRESSPELYLRVLRTYLTPEGFLGQFDRLSSGNIRTLEAALMRYVEENEAESMNEYMRTGTHNVDPLAFQHEVGESLTQRFKDMQANVKLEAIKYAAFGHEQIPDVETNVAQDILTNWRSNVSLKITPESLSAEAVSLDGVREPLMVDINQEVPASELFGRDVYARRDNEIRRVNPAMCSVAISGRDQRSKNNSALNLFKSSCDSHGIDSRILFDTGKFSSISTGAISPSSLEQLNPGQEVGKETPLVDEMLGGARSYGEFMKMLALGWYPQINSIPVRISDTGDVAFNFDLSPEVVNLSSSDLVQNYARGHFSEMGIEDFASLHDSISYTDHNLSFLVDRVINEGFWWRTDEPSHKFGNRQVPLRNFADLDTVRRMISGLGHYNDSTIQSTSILAVEAARKMIKHEIVKDMRSGRFSEIVTEEVVSDAGQESARLSDIARQTGNPEMARRSQDIGNIGSFEEEQAVSVDAVSSIAQSDIEADAIENQIDNESEAIVEEELGIEIVDEEPDAPGEEDEELEEFDIGEMEPEVSSEVPSEVIDDNEDDLDSLDDLEEFEPSEDDDFEEMEEDVYDPTSLFQRREPRTPELEEQVSEDVPNAEDPDDDDDDFGDIEEYLRSVGASTGDAGRGIMRDSLIRIARLSYELAQEGKTASSKEINQMIRKYMC